MTADQLLCGADVDDLIEQVANGLADERSDHQRGCPHCQAALAEFQRLWAPVHQLTSEPVAAPESMVNDVLQQIRGISTHTSWGVLTGALGQTRIADRVVAVTARVATEEVPGVRAALTTSTPTGDTPTDVVAGVSGISTALRITVAVGYGYDLEELAERIRSAVAERIQVMTGLRPVEVAVVIDDVLTS